MSQAHVNISLAESENVATRKSIMSYLDDSLLPNVNSDDSDDASNSDAQTSHDDTDVSAEWQLQSRS